MFWIFLLLICKTQIAQYFIIYFFSHGRSSSCESSLLFVPVRRPWKFPLSLQLNTRLVSNWCWKYFILDCVWGRCTDWRCALRTGVRSWHSSSSSNFFFFIRGGIQVHRLALTHGRGQVSPSCLQLMFFWGFSKSVTTSMYPPASVRTCVRMCVWPIDSLCDRALSLRFQVWHPSSKNPLQSEAFSQEVLFIFIVPQSRKMPLLQSASRNQRRRRSAPAEVHAS